MGMNTYTVSFKLQIRLTVKMPFLEIGDDVLVLYRKRIIDGFQKAIEPVPITMLSELTQPPLENTDDNVYSKVFRPVIERCQSSFLTVPRYITWSDRITFEDDINFDLVTSRDPCLFDDEYDSD